MGKSDKALQEGRFRYDVATISKQGGREYNQDYLGYEILEGGSCFVVCDGLGAYRGSEDASRVAVEALLGFFAEEPIVIDADAVEKNIVKTHRRIVEYKKQRPEISSSCTTLASLFVKDGRITVAHIGDTRCYYFADYKIVCYTEDHSVSQMAVRAGDIHREQIRKHEDRNKLLRVLGSERGPNPDIDEREADLKNGTFFLLCTDGFWEYVTEEEMEEDAKKAQTAAEWIKIMERRLLKRAPRYNDNYTAIAVKIIEAEPPTAEGVAE